MTSFIEGNAGNILIVSQGFVTEAPLCFHKIELVGSSRVMRQDLDSIPGAGKLNQPPSLCVWYRAKQPDHC